ncbi:MAG: hypothetical protein K6E10_04385 [Eubacterium sp.]|nr:hypothetical protein [Eubacterium sp.]
MYTTTVKVRKNDDSYMKKLLGLLVLWMTFFFISLYLFIKGILIFFFVGLIVFFMIIPIAIYLKKSRPSVAEMFEEKTLTFDAVNGELFKGNMKLSVGRYRGEDRIFLENTYWAKAPRYGGSYMVVNFMGKVEEPYLREFEDFLMKNGIQINDLGENK